MRGHEAIQPPFRSQDVIATRGTPGRIVLSIARQVSLSVLGTLTATAVMTTVQSRWAVRFAAPTVVAASRPGLPDLTAGGKFAARAIDGTEPEPFVALMQLPAVLPLFTAPAVPKLQPGAPDAVAVAGPTTGLLATTEPERTPVRREAHRAAPSRHAEANVVAMAPLPLLQPAALEHASLWSRSRSAYQTVAAWSGTVVDSLLP